MWRDGLLHGTLGKINPFPFSCSFFLEYLLKEQEYNSDSAHLSVCILGEFIENHRINTMVISQK